MYDEMMIAPMREELSVLGIQETRTPEAVEEALEKPGTCLVVVNSVCGCAAANARPAVTLALSGDKKPDHAITVFAGNDTQATAKARSYFIGYPPSSPCIGLLKEGELVFLLERHQIAGRPVEDVAYDIKEALAKHC
jgi:putative YphP/YqiW family bacilliredoxin